MAKIFVYHYKYRHYKRRYKIKKLCKRGLATLLARHWNGNLYEIPDEVRNSIKY